MIVNLNVEGNVFKWEILSGAILNTANSIHDMHESLLFYLKPSEVRSNWICSLSKCILTGPSFLG